MRKTVVISILAFVLCVALCFVSCAGTTTEPPSTGETPPSDGGTPPTGEDPNQPDSPVTDTSGTLLRISFSVSRGMVLIL